MSTAQLMNHQVDEPLVPRPDLINENLILSFCEKLHSHVAQATAHLRLPGCFYIFGLNHQTGECEHHYFGIGNPEAMGRCAIDLAARGFNVWMPGCTLREGSKCSYSDIRWVFALVIDWDSEGVVPIRESLAVRTSSELGEHAQFWYFTSLSAEEAYGVGLCLKQAAQADSKTGVVTQKYRLPGTPNYPSKEKREKVHLDKDGNVLLDENGQPKRRRTEPTGISPWHQPHGPVYSLEQFNALLPPLPAGHQSPHIKNVVYYSGDIDVIGRPLSEIVVALPPSVNRYIGIPVPQVVKRQNAEGTGPCRHHHLYIASCLAFDAGITANEFTRYLIECHKHAPQSYAAKFLVPGDRSIAGPSELLKEIDRIYEKWECDSKGARRARQNAIEQGRAMFAQLQAGRASP